MSSDYFEIDDVAGEMISVSMDVSIRIKYSFYIFPIEFLIDFMKSCWTVVKLFTTKYVDGMQ